MAYFRCGKNNSSGGGSEIKEGVWTVKIDQNNSNPETCCTYADDAVGMTKASSEWDTLFGYKPCVMKQGVVQGYLNPNDFTKYEDGTDAPIKDNAYDVMIEFPRRGIKFSKDENNIVSVSITTNPNKEGFSYNAHRRNDEQKDYVYISAYACSSVVYSSSDYGTSYLYSNSTSNYQTNGSTCTFDEAVKYAKGRGDGYQLMGWFQYMYIQVLFVLKYGTLACGKTELGYGYTSTSGYVYPGIMNKKGMCYGGSSETTPVKVFGIENFWGGNRYWLAGIYFHSSNEKIYFATDGTSMGDVTYYIDMDDNIYSFRNTYINYITEVQGTNELGFFPAAGGGSSTTYYQAYFSKVKYYNLSVGGDTGKSTVQAYCGPFCLHFDYASTVKLLAHTIYL